MKPKELYLGKCVNDLTKMGESIEQKAYPKILLKSMDKVLIAARDCELDGDQEKAYVLMIRYCTIFQTIIKSRDYTVHKTYYDSMLNRKVIASVVDDIATLQTQLSDRFEERDAKALLERTAKLKIQSDNDNARVAPKQVKKIPDPKDVPRSRSPDERKNSKPASSAWMSVTSFADIIRSPASTTGPRRPIVFDVRPEDLTSVSSLKFDRIISIPPTQLHEGCTISDVSKVLQSRPEALSLFQERGQARQIFLLDQHSSPPGSAPLLQLKAALFQWDAAELVRSEPVAVDGGFDAVVDLYPTLVTNVQAYRGLLSAAEAKARAATDAGGGFATAVSAIRSSSAWMEKFSIQYPDLDARQRRKKEEEEAARRHKEEALAAARRRQLEEEAAAQRRLEESRSRQDSAMEAERRRRAALREQQRQAASEEEEATASLMREERGKNKARQLNGETGVVAPPEVNRSLKPSSAESETSSSSSDARAERSGAGSVPMVNRQLKPSGKENEEVKEMPKANNLVEEPRKKEEQERVKIIPSPASNVSSPPKPTPQAPPVPPPVVNSTAPPPVVNSTAPPRPVIKPTPSVRLDEEADATTGSQRLSGLQSTHARDRLSFAAKGGAKLTTVDQQGGGGGGGPAGSISQAGTALPGGAWERHFDERTNRYYYVDLTSQTTSWSSPYPTKQTDGEKLPPSTAAFRVTKTRLRDDEDSSSSASWTSGAGGKLKRSSSQPNLVPPAAAHRHHDDDEAAGATVGATAAPPKPPTTPTTAAGATRQTSLEALSPSETRQPAMPSRDSKPRLNSSSEAEFLHMDSVQLTHMCPEYGNTVAGLTGLRNLGNTCYMNSVIQALANTRHLCMYIQNDNYRFDINRANPAGHRGEVAEEFSIIIKTLWAGRYRTISPSKFKQTVSRHNTMFASNEQQDSQEFLLFLLDGLHEDLNRAARGKGGQKPPAELEDERLSYEKRAVCAWQWHKQLNESFIVEMFQGQFKSTVQCLTCRYESTTFDVFMYLSLQIPTSRLSASYPTLTECVDQFVKEEKMTGSSQWHCSRCKANRDAVKKIDIWRLPPYLLIHLKRFSFDNSLRQKMNTMVSFPLHGLEIEQGGRRADQKGHVASSRVYDLYAVSNHYGSMESGHYTAFCLNSTTSKWYKFDDEMVTPIPTTKIKSPAAYILFYAVQEPSISRPR